MRRWLWFIAIAVLGTAVLGLVVLLRPPPINNGVATRATSTRAPGVVVATKSSVVLDMATPDRSASAAPADIASAAPLESRVSRAAEPSEVRDHVEAVFRDSGAATTRDLGLALQSELPGALPAGSQIRSLECRAGFCRIEVSHPSELAFEDFMRRAFDPRSSKLVTGPVFAGPLGAPVSGEPFVAVIFVAEYGRTLPIPESH